MLLGGFETDVALSSFKAPGNSEIINEKTFKSIFYFNTSISFADFNLRFVLIF